MAVLGSMFLSPTAAEEVLELLEPSDFYRPAHATMFSAMRRLAEQHMPVDLTTVHDELAASGKLAEVGGQGALIEIAGYVPSPANAHYYAMIVQDRSTMRRLEKAGRDVIGMARDPGESNAAERVNQAEQAIYEVGKRRLGSYFESVGHLSTGLLHELDDIYTSGQAKEGLVSKFDELDSRLNGLNGTDLIIAAARPGMGKTSLMLDLALRAAEQERGNVAFFSLEMGSEQITKRLVSMTCGVNAFKLKTPADVGANYDAVVDAVSKLVTLPIMIDSTSGITPLEMRGKCRRLRNEGGLALVLVDYLQLMQSSRRSENRVQEISEIARSLKAMAKELNVPVIAGSQLNRGVEARDDKRPQLGDLRESGSIEAEADIVMLLYRQDYYDQKDADYEEDYNPDRVYPAEINVAKNRNGGTGVAVLGFQSTYTRFRNLTPEDIELYRQQATDRKRGMGGGGGVRAGGGRSNFQRKRGDED